LKLSHGTIDAPLARSASNRKKIAVVEGRRGKRAVTHWRRLEVLNDATLAECRLETGRTHQVRVHMASIGHPLLGDSVYGAGFKTKARLLPEAAQTALDALDRQALHAAILGFEHPVTGEPLRFESQLPKEFSKLIKALQKAAGP
jgi:23S rRNA pseudouridine1911/1915/1917 synthase